jgi:hypothetical protein
MSELPLQVEPGGITYDRYRLGVLFERLLREHRVARVIEVPADGEKAMPSISSLALGRLGCEVVLVNPSPAGLEAWERLGLRDQVVPLQVDDLAALPLPDDCVDLAWNFVTLGKTGRFEKVLAEMARVSRRLVMTVHNNGWNIGYPWHRLLHLALRLPWTHGDTRYHWPSEVRRAYAELGLLELELEVFDSPPWPDPPGFRDVRLHRALGGGGDVASCRWQAPIVDYYAEQRFPAWMRWLSRAEDLGVPTPLRAPFSHLFYALYKVP